MHKGPKYKRNRLVNRNDRFIDSFEVNHGGVNHVNLNDAV